MLARFALHFDHGDGRTEFFADGALAMALQYLDLFCAHLAPQDSYKRGVVRPMVSAPSRRPRRSHQARLIRKAKAVPASVLLLAEKFARINRLLLMLKRRQHRIPFQFDIDADMVLFRTIVEPRRKDAVFDLMGYFSFDITDFNGWCYLNCCTVTGVNDVMQFRITFPRTGDDSTWGSLFSYFSQQSEGLLKALPKRSAAATQPIPPWDEKRFWDDFGK